MANLKTGSSGSEVKKMQEALIKAGYDVGNTKADGVFGNNTLAAVKQYQKDNGLAVDGIAGPKTLGKMYAVTADGDVANSRDPLNGDKPKQEPAAGTPRTEVPSFSHNPYAKSDVVQQAETLLQQHNASAPAYSSQWQAQINAYLNKIMNRDPFSYNFNEDALYQQYKDIYTQMGLMAMMDTMGQASAMTGGYGNSYAQTVGQQAYNQQLSQLNNVLPELYQMAYDRYAYEGDQLYQQYGLLMDQENMDYGRYMDAYNQWANERDYLAGRYDTLYQQDYNQYRDGYDQAWDEYVMEYQIGRDQVGDEQWQATFDEGVRQYEEGKAADAAKGNGNIKPVGREDDAYWNKEVQRTIEDGGSTDALKARMKAAGLPDAYINALIGSDSGGDEDDVDPDTGLSDARKDEIEAFVERMLTNGNLASGFDPAKLIQGSSFFASDIEREYALEMIRYLGELR